ncbi:leucine-rich repeat domain-containing protein [Histomonas meleagridis]|uniref:leucine-rich repeat domain-containing protein n=1 Tax=Histomonas meleagridis TaxID=135588 RepID=UPI00355971CC|nr:leucine-rich repeat domain-containing protein [Histomonas meleagridis]KAH0803908.1 leucine-rich repeat domain-containing protein [Histomonas meleagridis]
MSDFTQDYKYVTKRVIIDVVSEVIGRSFADWPLLSYAEIKNSVTLISGFAFNRCPSLTTVYLSENINKISDYAFSNSSIISITIPNSVSILGNQCFSQCQKLNTLILGNGIESIGKYAFFNCTSLKCVYYYGDSTPTTIGNPFVSCPVDAIMTLTTFLEEYFYTFYAVKGSIIEGCSPPPTPKFTQSNAFTESNTFTKSNAFTESNTFTKSNTFTNSYTFTKSNEFSESRTFTQSLPSGAYFTYSFQLTNTILVTHTMSILNASISYTLLAPQKTSELVFYEYTVIRYSTYMEFYQKFIYMELPTEVINEGLSQLEVVGIVCGAIAAIVIIAVSVVCTIRNSKNAEETIQKNYEKSYEYTPTEEFSPITFNLIKDEKDQWLL